MKVAVVVGNPKPASRTRHAATMLAEKLTGRSPDLVVDVIDFGAGLLGWEDEKVRVAVADVGSADLAVFASPTFKTSYTGVLKLFLDQFAGGTGLAGTVAVPLMLGAGPGHALAPDLLLKPVLVELGASCPAPGLYVVDRSYETDPALDDYVQRWGPQVRTLAEAMAAAR